jgi:hypothetical protein
MSIKLKKIDAVILVSLIIISVIFLYKAGYVDLPFLPPAEPSPEPNNVTIPKPELPTPPTSLIPSYRREVSPDDEGVHYNKLRISREWWYFGAVFNNDESELKNWTVVISFNHMARGDLLGTQKPDLLAVSLQSPEGDTYGGMINKKRYLGILETGTLIANSPGLNLKFEGSWAEGEYPTWHVHAEDEDIDSSHEIIIDLDYQTSNLPIWTLGSRAFDQSKSSIANYLFLGCDISGTVSIDGEEFMVKGAGHYEHSWTPHLVTTGLINGWDWFCFTLENGWQIYMSNYYPTPQAISTKTPNTNPFGTLLVSTDNGNTFTELRNVDLKITQSDERIFPFVRMPLDFKLTAKPSANPLYLVSQSLLYGSYLKLDVDIEVQISNDRAWKFPTYLGMKIGLCTIDGTLSWSDDDGDHELPIMGVGNSWSMRALL